MTIINEESGRVTYDLLKSFATNLVSLGNRFLFEDDVYAKQCFEKYGFYIR